MPNPGAGSLFRRIGGESINPIQAGNYEEVQDAANKADPVAAEAKELWVAATLNARLTSRKSFRWKVL